MLSLQSQFSQLSTMQETSQRFSTKWSIEGLRCETAVGRQKFDSSLYHCRSLVFRVCKMTSFWNFCMWRSHIIPVLWIYLLNPPRKGVFKHKKLSFNKGALIVIQCHGEWWVKTMLVRSSFVHKNVLCSCTLMDIEVTCNPYTDTNTRVQVDTKWSKMM